MKLGMILGGIGTVRLASKRTKFGIIHFLGATSSGDSNQGIPLCVPRDIYGELAGDVKGYGGMQCEVGELSRFSTGPSTASASTPEFPDMRFLWMTSALSAHLDLGPSKQRHPYFTAAPAGNTSEITAPITRWDGRSPTSILPPISQRTDERRRVA